MEDPTQTLEKRSFPLRHTLISFLADLDVKGVRRIAHHLPRLLIPDPGEACIMKTLHGFWLQIDPARDQGLDRSIYYTGTYEKGTLAVMKNLLSDGDIFVDAGANIGLMSIYASRLVGSSGRVFAFEPHPETAEILEENIRLNGCKNISVSRQAVGKEPGRAKIYNRWDSPRGRASLIPPGDSSESHEVSVTTLSEYLISHQKDIREISMVKLDIEGYELEALMGAGRLLEKENAPMLIVECSEKRENAQGSSPEDLYSFLMELGHYRIFRGRKDKGRTSRLVEVSSTRNLPRHDNIYCFTKRHLEKIPRRIIATV